jgi:[ribosomal protein S18]-alanine N-acetyltransferase
VASVKEELEFPEAEIRPMHELDVPVVVAIERSSYQFPWSEGIFRDCLRVGYICRVVEVGGDIAGYGIMSMGAGEAHVLNVCVRSEYRGRSLARKVLVYLIDRARNAGMYEAFLEVRPSNTTAARLYQSLGFEQVGVRRGYYQATHGREDAAVLRRILQAQGK